MTKPHALPALMFAESTQLKNKDVKGVLAALQTVAYAEVNKTEKFVILQLTRLKHCKNSWTDGPGRTS